MSENTRAIISIPVTITLLYTFFYVVNWIDMIGKWWTIPTWIILSFIFFGIWYTICCPRNKFMK